MRVRAPPAARVEKRQHQKCGRFFVLELAKNQIFGI